MASSTPFSAARLSVAAVVCLACIGVGVAWGVSSFRRLSGPVMEGDGPAAPAGVPAAAALPQPAAPAPAFDIVRVAPDGAAVIAGRAEPGATVTVRENGQVVGQAHADSHGTWMLIPDNKLLPGAGELTLASQGRGGAVSQADAPVLVVVPTPAAPGTPALALLAPADAPSRVLQAPATRPAPEQPAQAPQPAGSKLAATQPPGRKLGLDTVDYDEGGAIRFSGSAPPDAPVRVYVDNAPVGDAKAGRDGHWAMSPPAEVPPGVHTLRLDQLGVGGRVASRVEMPFQRETLALSQVADGQVVVQPGQNLWRLARRAYGSGIRYTVIFLANREQIRDARLIYPGQVFAVPGGGAPAVTPAVAR